MVTGAKINNDPGIYIDIKYFADALKKSLFVIFGTEESKRYVKKTLDISEFGIDRKKEIEDKIFSLITKYSPKVPNRNVVKVVESTLLESGGIGLAIYPGTYINLIAFDIDIVTKEINGVYFIIEDKQKFEFLMNVFKKRALEGQQLTQEEISQIKSIIKDSIDHIESYLPDYYYSIYAHRLLLELTLNIEYLSNAYFWVPNVAKVIKEFIDTNFKQYRVTKDDNLMYLATMAVLSNQYYTISDYEKYLLKLAEITNIPEKYVYELIQAKVTQFKKITQLPILLKNLGLYIINMVEFIHRLNTTLNRYFDLSMLRISHLITAIILSKYPQDIVSRQLYVDPETIDKIESETLKLVQ